jgi:hypothetical protein
MRMRREWLSLLVALSTLSLSACAIQTWAPGPGKVAAELGPDSARCRLLARGTEPDTSFEASGSPKTVAIAATTMAVMGGIATAVHDSETYNDCMQAAGWIPVGQTQSAVVASAVPLPVTAAPLPDLPAASTSAPAPPLAVAMTPLPEQAAEARERSEAAERAEAAAQAWLVAEEVLNSNSDSQKRGLYGALCGAGDRSACVMAMALSRSQD